MDASIRKRVFALVVAVLMIAVFGCGKAALDAKSTEIDSNEAVAIETDASMLESETTADYSGIYNVDETTDESTSGSYDSSTADENTILVQNAGTLAMSSADINKTGDADEDFSLGQNAAVAVTTQGRMTLTDSNVTSNALGGYGLCAVGEGSQLDAENAFVVTSGASSPVLDGAQAAITGCTLSTEGEDSPCLLFGSDTGAALTDTTLSAKSGLLVRVLSGECRLTLSATALTGGLDIAEGAMLTLVLTNGASFTGELGGELPALVGLSLDETSTLTLTADAYVGSFVNADTAHQNVQSGGFSIYYDSNAPENEYLGGQSFLLPGGGFLSPII